MMLEALSKNEDLNLQRICMSGNDFGKDGMAVLADVLKRMKPEHIELREVISSRNKHNGL